MQMVRPTLTEPGQDVHLSLKDFKQVSKLDERLLGVGSQTVHMGFFQLLLNGMCNNNKMFFLLVWIHYVRIAREVKL